MSEIYTLTSQMLNQSKRLDNVAHNIANVNTNGFKRQELSFKSALENQQASYGTTQAVVAERNIDFSSGNIEVTNNSLDLSLNGDGFFSYDRNGSKVYSRDGRLQINTQGELVNTHNERILGIDGQPIEVKENEHIYISPEGEVTSSEGSNYGQIALFKFADNAVLVDAGQASFVSPVEPTQFNDRAIIVGALEGSNVNAIKESVDLTTVTRAYESAAGLVKDLEDLESRAILDLYKVSQ